EVGRLAPALWARHCEVGVGRAGETLGVVLAGAFTIADPVRVGRLGRRLPTRRPGLELRQRIRPDFIERAVVGGAQLPPRGIRRGLAERFLGIALQRRWQRRIVQRAQRFVGAEGAPGRLYLRLDARTRRTPSLGHL